ncbi:uncharacterized protein LOC120341512 [Styela clava]
MVGCNCRILWKLLFVALFAMDYAEANDLGELPTNRPLIIAHRGASGMLPEHTVEAYQLAIEQGADVIECDLAVTKDAQLVCTHEPWLNHSTDVHSHVEFRDRAKTYFIPSDLGFRTDYFTIDFTLEELKTLRKVQTRSYRDQSYNGEFAMASFDEYIAVAQNQSNPRTIGIYPETKVPDFFNKYLEDNGTTMEDILLESLESYGYDKKNSPCFLQSFDIRSLQYLRNRTELKLVYLTGSTLTNDIMEELSTYVSGIGPSKSVIVQIDPIRNTIIGTTTFLARAHQYGFVVHPFTFRNEYQFLAYDYGSDPYKEYELFINHGVDGLFTDFPGSLNNYLTLGAVEECPTDEGTILKTDFVLILFVAIYVMYKIEFVV